MSQPTRTAKFVDGSILRHILVMSSTAAMGISAVFLVDLVDMFFLSFLNDVRIVSGVGFATTISFFTISIGIGLSIALGALMSRAVGAHDWTRAKRVLVNSSLVTLVVAVVMATMVLSLVTPLLALIGASGQTAEYAASYLHILVPSMPIICLNMSLSSALRAVGDAKMAMYSTLVGALVNLVFDPLLIFGVGLGIEGAAIASVLARFGAICLSAYAIFYKHKLWMPFNFVDFKQDLRPILAIATPAMLTNFATPFGNAFVTKSIANFGDSFVAGFAIIGRITPVAFGMIFALSGAVGPIIGQNYGAGMIGRLRESLTKALQFCTAYVLLVSALLFLIQDYLVEVFDMQGDAAALIHFFCTSLAVFFAFNGALFVANATFNNLGKPRLSMYFNIGKATLGTIPFVLVGAQLSGVFGVLVGQAIGSVLFALIGVFTAYRLVNRLQG
ncbi:MATE family efflux transporter [Shewanella avicenniae]|uniref:Multidrug-efflux transporter n=1 Tax=Shewanella avicenniae TaxID=2814294 RepID=A0ABX7QLE6_9GAMM|nr:MATE family efflux transporter [Shewanella avicenniae]QSX32089.1 MATE family efflux transporter [Shewanella avicenniae]